MKATARLIKTIVRNTARVVGRISMATAAMTDISGLRKFLHVWPTKPQEVTWVRKEDSVEYHVTSNTDWTIN